MQAIANSQHADAWNGWEGVHWAQNHDRYDATVSAFNDDLFRIAAIGADDRVLDIGCGTGQTTLLAARRASRGRVVGVDISAPMLDRARAEATDQGIVNVSFEQGDAQVHPFPDGGFDVAISRGGVMFFEDLVAAFANIRRGLRPGGRLAFMGPQGGSPDSDYARATAALKPLMRAPSPAARGMGALTDPARIREVLGRAGFADVGVMPVEALMDYGRDAADATEFILGQGPVRFNLQGVGEDVVERTRRQLRAGLAAYETSDGVRIPGAVWLVSAVRP
ncbi:class I SAM-dependent methyltransferase [Actinoallomurus rhizosphaericola]|uniref:class I SAM-dependent methyltransferase n=1 Tax=Actinoallomurus rhizosphaericola TaxID=2952536 RepID=UPI0020909EF0|nr:class I SAM-dependent methyltransferase [Actinoallomurus rhizosphaericola]MCO5994449.1 methyltransferase domain-containing protein [Actinoallomurus rhizosphaericola]